MSLPRRTLWLLASAIPTLLITAWALWILHDFLAIRDRLGHWRLTARTADGAVVGAGQADLTVASWTMSRQPEAPFVSFQPHLDSSGSLHLEAAGRKALAGSMGSICDRPDFTLTSASLGDGGAVHMMVWATDSGEFSGYCDIFPRPAPLYWFTGRRMQEIPLTLQAER